MKRWFDRLPIHKKMVAMAVAVTTIALAATTVGLVAIDLWRYRTNAIAETAALAEVVAETNAAAILFLEPDTARDSLSTLRVRPVIRRACLYLPDGTLFAAFARSGAACGAMPSQSVAWDLVGVTAAVRRNQRLVGTVYLERELSDIWTRVAIAVAVGGLMITFAAMLAYTIAQRLHRTISTPIAQLAAAAGAIGGDEQQYVFPSISAPPDEVGQLVVSFTAMVDRLRIANARLVESNAAREELLVKERQASRLKDEFLATVSHELRTPLNAILGWIQVLNTTTPNEQATAKAIASIARNARAQTRLIEDLVDVSRIVTGKLQVRWDPVDLREAAEAALEVIRPMAALKQIALTVEIPEGRCPVNGDRDRLQQVAANLLSNAVKFTPEGGVVALTIAVDEDGYQLRVSDSGIGVPPEFLPHVFDRFRQADASTTRKYGGLGLGLSIVKELTELHGGRVTAVSEGQGRGATFSVWLPRMKGLEPAAADGGGQVIRSENRLRGVQILAVDDNPDALETTAEMLTIAGARVRTACCGADAIREYIRQRPQLLICDLAMPLMDGFEVLEQVRRHDALDGRHTPTIALTAHASGDFVTRTRTAGFSFLVTKPVDATTLLEAVAAALDADRADSPVT
jgi:signal transduction histidine kinase/ActR/RegA family two-component response regulator